MGTASSWSPYRDMPKGSVPAAPSRKPPSALPSHHAPSNQPSNLPPRQVYVPELNQWVDYSTERIVMIGGRPTIQARDRPIQTSEKVASPVSQRHGTVEEIQKEVETTPLPEDIWRRTEEGKYQTQREAFSVGFEKAFRRAEEHYAKKESTPTLLGTPTVVPIKETPKKAGFTEMFLSPIFGQPVEYVGEGLYRTQSGEVVPESQLTTRRETISSFAAQTVFVAGSSVGLAKLSAVKSEWLDKFYRGIGFKIPMGKEYFVVDTKRSQFQPKTFEPEMKIERTTGSVRKTSVISYKPYADTRSTMIARAEDVFRLMPTSRKSTFLRLSTTTIEPKVITQKYVTNKVLGIKYLGEASVQRFPTEAFTSVEPITVTAKKTMAGTQFFTGKGRGYYFGMTSRETGFFRETFKTVEIKKPLVAYSQERGAVRIGKAGTGFTEQDIVGVSITKGVGKEFREAGVSTRFARIKTPTTTTPKSFVPKSIFSGTGVRQIARSGLAVDVKLASKVIATTPSPMLTKGSTLPGFVSTRTGTTLFPMTATRTVTETKVTTRTATMPGVSDLFKTIALPRLETKIATLTGPKTRTGTIAGTTTITKTAQATRTTTITQPRTAEPIIVPPIMPSRPSIETPRALPSMFIPKSSSFGMPSLRGKKKRKGTVSIFGYRPSFKSAVLGTTTRKKMSPSKLYTPFEERPIEMIGKRRKKMFG